MDIPLWDHIKIQCRRFRIFNDRFFNPHKRWEVRRKPFHKRPGGIFCIVLLLLLCVALFVKYKSGETTIGKQDEKQVEEKKEVQDVEEVSNEKEQGRDQKTPDGESTGTLLENATTTPGITSEVQLSIMGKVESTTITTNQSSYTVRQKVFFLGREHLVDPALSLKEEDVTFEAREPLFGIIFDFGSIPLTDLEGAEMTLLGAPSYVGKVTAENNNFVMDLLQGEQVITLKEGEQQKIQYGGKEYLVEVSVITNPEPPAEPSAKLKINDQLSETMDPGETTLFENIRIAAARILAQEGNDTITLLWNSTKLRFQDSDFTSDALNSHVKKGDDALDFSAVNAYLDDDQTHLQKLVYTYLAPTSSSDKPLQPPTKLSQYLGSQDPLLVGTWDIQFREV